MATWTKKQLATAILKHLALVGDGQSAPASLQKDTEDAVDSIHLRLKKQGIAPYQTSAIPEAYQVPMVEYIAYRLCPRYGIRGQARLDFKDAAQEAYQAMEEESAAEDNGEPTRVDFV